MKSGSNCYAVCAEESAEDGEIADEDDNNAEQAEGDKPELDQKVEFVEVKELGISVRECLEAPKPQNPPPLNIILSEI